MSADTSNTPIIPPVTPEERLSSAESLVRRNVLWSFGAGVLPVPLFDLAAAIVVQVKMIKELSNLYGVPFREDLVKKLLASLIGGGLGLGLGVALGISLAKVIPGIGTALGVVTVPVVIGALTYATGRVFIMHFESGGNLLDFDAAGMRAHFKAEFESGRDLVERMYEAEKAKAAAPRTV
jgi:uncharacterized protein (DUF697 family)